MNFGRNWPWRELLLVAGLYLVFGGFYMLAIYYSSPPEYRGTLSYRILYLDYPLKALYTLPVWYLTFRVFARWSLLSKVALNVVLLPVWVKGWQWTYYWLCDTFFGGGHLVGSGEWWDVYIPALFYVLQFGIFHSWTYYQDLRVAEVARAEASRMALHSELSALKAQLNPHFLYNAFNTISASTGPGQERTRDMIAQLSDLFRYQLRANRENQLPLRSELQFVTDYLALERARFGDRLTYEISVGDPKLYDALLPPLLLQPLVENAVRHGLLPLMEGGSIRITARMESDRLSLSVTDDGAGFILEEVSYGYGIQNTRRRLALLFDADLIISSSPGRGTTCTFSIPIAHAPQSSRDRRRSARPQAAAGIPE
ncbi:signal transduction histidine kinase [Lewinella aquimaris]|uniref:Signal transduction histidine kinase n=1 Tax=Neolewinella aquimaris TaxID=1835722 RepID=A0A840E4T5_9BACT|nr:histidine kinase [Neolewinella aquimaris]MBB4078665.1 signal transduction histidine kinase [Neolewinella aquimaris]